MGGRVGLGAPFSTHVGGRYTRDLPLRGRRDAPDWPRAPYRREYGVYQADDDAPEEAHTVTFLPTCDCNASMLTGGCVVLDPFGGTGTTAEVAIRNGRSAILVDVSREYLSELAGGRTDGVQTGLIL